ncbi:MAG: energy transducer TonB [Bacteroidales bacterium]
MKKYIISIVILILISSANLIGQEDNPMLTKLSDDVGESTYLKDFNFELDARDESRISFVLSRSTIYSVAVYQPDSNMFEINLFPKKSEVPEPPSEINYNKSSTEKKYKIKETGVYHLTIKNNSANPLNALILLSLVDKFEISENKENKTSITKDNIKKSENSEQNETENIYFKVDKMPKFKDKKRGFKDFNEFIKTEMKYPQDALEQKIEGRVYVQFTVDKNGYIKNAKIVRGVQSSLDQEVLRIIYSSPKWEPGIKDGEPVDVVLTFPVEFNPN